MKQKRLFQLFFMLLFLLGMNAGNAYGQTPTPHWTAVSGGYSSNIPMLMTVTLNGEKLTEADQIEVGAFAVSDDECRATEFIVYEAGVSDHIVMLSVQGDPGEEIYFRIYDHKNSKEYALNLSLTVEEGTSFGLDYPLPVTVSGPVKSTLTIGSMANGSVTAAPSGDIEAGTSVTLTVNPVVGYELNSISAYKSNEQTVTYPLTGSGIIAGSTYTFNMPGYNTTVSATFRLNQAQIDVNDAKTAVEGHTYAVAQGTANTEAEVKDWLVTEINTLLSGTGITVAADDISISNFTAAVGGGSDGAFDFTVRLSKADASDVTASVPSSSCEITAKAAQSTPPAAPTVSGTPTAVSITLNDIPNAEYSKDDGASWQDSPTFDNLTPNTGYTFCARLKETFTHAASPASAASATITTARAALGGTVTISGTAIFDETLTAETSFLTSTPVVTLGTLTYQWLRDDVDIGGATGATYTLEEADISATITVKVTISNCAGSVTSAPTGAVAKATLPEPAAPTVASVLSTSITLNTIAYAEYSIDDGASWQDSPTFVGLTPNTGYTFRARIKETSTHNASSKSPSVTITTGNADLGGTVTISGTAIFGETLTAITTGLTSTPVVTLGTPAYQWLRDGTDISGATGATYTLEEADINATITVKVTISNCAGSVTSAPTGAVSKATPSAPTAPSEDTKTENSITLVVIPGAEYSMDDVSWQDSPTFGSLAPGTSYTFYARIKETATHDASSSISASISTNVAVITINVHPAANTAVTQGAITGSLGVTASVTGGATLSYEWFVNGGNSNSGGTPTGISASTFAIPTTLTAGTYYYYCEVSATGGAATVASAVAVVTVSAAGTTNAASPDITDLSAPVSTPYGGSALLSVTAVVTDGGTLSYQWHSNTVNSNSGGAAIPDATGASYAPPVTSVGVIYYYVKVTNTNTHASITGVKTVAVVSAPVAVTVTPAYTATVSPTAKTFTTATEGYGVQPAQQFVITNTGSEILTNVQASLGGTSDFEISAALSTPTVGVGGTATVSVRPKTGLAAGNHTGVLTFTGDNGLSVASSLTFKVAVAPPTVFTVIFDGNGGVSDEASRTVSSGAAVGTLPSATRTGYLFDGWYTSASDGYEVTSGYVITANETFYAHWTEIPPVYYTLTIPSVEGITTTPGAGAYTLEEGETLYLYIYPQPDYILNEMKVYVNGTEVIPDQQSDGSYRVYLYINTDLTVRIEGLRITGIESLQANSLKAYAVDGVLHVGGLTPGSPWSIYSAAGALICRNVAEGEEAKVNLPTRGVYIVTSGKEVVKTIY